MKEIESEKYKEPEFEVAPIDVVGSLIESKVVMVSDVKQKSTPEIEKSVSSEKMSPKS